MNRVVYSQAHVSTVAPDYIEPSFLWSPSSSFAIVRALVILQRVLHSYGHQCISDSIGYTSASLHHVLHWHCMSQLKSAFELRTWCFSVGLFFIMLLYGILSLLYKSIWR